MEQLLSQTRTLCRHLPWRQLTGLFCIFVVGLCFWLDEQQDHLSQQFLRLHVLANSDTSEDQALKLRVRDALLVEVAPWLAEVSDVEAVKTTLSAHLPALSACAAAEIQAAGYDYPVRVELQETWFPTREYEGFALPAGDYEALRVLIGEAAGQNWWCVVFPPLCVASSTQTVPEVARSAGVDEQEVFLILEEQDEYVIKFRAIEIWESLKHRFA